MIARTLTTHLRRTASGFRVVFLTGPRQSGKTTLARATFPDFAYVSLEDPQNRQEAMDAPRAFLRRLQGEHGVILDEVQRVPDLFSYLQGVVDERRCGPFILTGSQQFLLSDSISQSLAGRAAVLALLPFSVAELARREAMGPDDFAAAPVAAPVPAAFDLDEMLFKGMYPEIHDQGLDPYTWHAGYVQTYLERDVRAVAAVTDLDVFTRFLRICAGRSGRLLNKSELGRDAGVSHVTAAKWLSILRASHIVDFLLPFHRNFAKRLVKTPKLYFLDSGLLCHLLGLRRAADLRGHPMRGSIFESFVLSELQKLFLHRGEQPPLYFFRDSNGFEVDVIVDLGTRCVPVEIKAAEHVPAAGLGTLDRFAAISGGPGGVLVVGGTQSYPGPRHQIRSWAQCT